MCNIKKFTLNNLGQFFDDIGRACELIEKNNPN